MEAFQDYNNEKEDRIGLMGCFCKEYAIKNPKTFASLSFEELAETVDPSEDYLYCKTWAINFAV